MKLRSDLDVSGGAIVNLSSPSLPTDGANKAYVDSISYALTPTYLTHAASGEAPVVRFSFPSSVLSPGSLWALRLTGQVSSTATVTYRVRIGTTGTTTDAVAATFVSAAGVANAFTGLDVVCRVLTAGVSGTLRASGIGHLNATNLPPVAAAYTPATVNTTAVNIMSVTVQHSVAQTYTPFAATLRRA